MQCVEEVEVSAWVMFVLTKSFRSPSKVQRRRRRHSIASHQRASVASPSTLARDLVEASAGVCSESNPATGGFHDLASLLEHFDEPAIFILGAPLPDERFLPRPRAGRCPAAHNRLLTSEDLL